MSYLTEAFFLLSITASGYVTGASICRLRHGDISKGWATLYAAVLGLAMWTLLDLAQGSATLKDGAIVIAVAAYVFMTRKSWFEGVPKIAKREVYE